MPPASIRSASPRRRGAPPGNHNAYKHGFYNLQPHVIKRLNQDLKGEFTDEIEALRSLALTTITTFYAIPDPTLEQCLATLRGVSQSFDTVRSLSLTKKLLYNNQTSMQQIIDALGDLPVDQD